MKYTIEEFAQEIRRLYPNDYNDLSDKKLVQLWLKKYPKDKTKVDIDNDYLIAPGASEILPKDASENIGWGDLLGKFISGIFTTILQGVASIIIGVPLSYYFQPEKVREFYTLPQYIRAIPDLALSEKEDFLSAILFSVIGVFVFLLAIEFIISFIKRR